jgi:hypothetical protein
VVLGVNTCLSDYVLAMKHAVDSKGLLILILHRNGQELLEACSPFEPSGRHAWVKCRCLCSFVVSLWTLKVVIVAIRSWLGGALMLVDTGASATWVVISIVVGWPVASREKLNYTSNYKFYKDTVGCKNTKMR